MRLQFKNIHCAPSNSSSSDDTDSSMFDDLWDSESGRQTVEACPAISGSRLRSLFSKDTTGKDSSSGQLDVSDINQGDCGSSVGSGESDNEDHVCSPETRQRFLTEFRNRLSRLKQLTQPQTSSLTDPDRLKQLNQRLQEIVQRNIALKKDEMDKFWVDLNVRIPKREPATADQFGVGQLSATNGKGGAVKTKSTGKSTKRSSAAGGSSSNQGYCSNTHLFRLQVSPKSYLCTALQPLLVRLGLLTDTRGRPFQMSLNGFLVAQDGDNAQKSQSGRSQPQEVCQPDPTSNV
uniref:TBC1 domain family member 30 n=1 Tax=Macrostomum lignano TaxID=282301 RepID=A0A1I8FYQ5_9PLAT